MTLPRETVTSGVIAEYQALAETIRSLLEDEWRRPTRCEGWTVGDVSSHVAGILDDVVHFRLDGIGTPEATQRQVDDRRSLTPDEVADEIARNAKLALEIAESFDDASWEGPAPAPIAHTLGWGIEGLWYDTYVHREDVLAGLGRPPACDLQGLRASVSHLAQLLTDQGWAPATLALDGVDEYEVSGGGGRTITGEPLEFVLVATGRADPSTLGLDESVNVYRG